MRPSDPGRLEFRPERHDQQHADRSDLIDDPAEHFQARRVGPMRVLEDHQHRAVAAPSASICETSASSVLCRRCCGSARARDSVRRSAATASRRRARHPPATSALCASSASSLSSFASRRVVVRQPGRALHLADDRMKRAVGVLRRAEIAQARMRLGGEAFAKRGRQPRFADAGLAGEQHDLALARLRRCDQRRSSSSNSSSRPTSAVRPSACSASKRLSTELARSAAQARAGPAMPLSSCAPRSSSSKRSPSKLARASAMTTLSGSAIALQTRREVRRLADDPALLRLPGTHEIADHHEPGRDADPDMQRSADRRRQMRHGLDDREPGLHRALGVVLMRLRIAEIREHAVAHIFGDEAAIRRDVGWRKRGDRRR